MKAVETNLFKFLEGNRQFIIPIYQRTYSWSQEQCMQLWRDIENIATNPEIKAHFVGSIVYIQQGLYQATALPQLLVIDGQQRLTTLTLLLIALAKTAQKDTSTNLNDQIYDYFLINRYGKDDDHYKLLLTQSDRSTLKALINGYDMPTTASKLLVENFDFFTKQIASCQLDLATLYESIGKLILVDIALDRDYDDPQLIFESLNSTGMDLSQADLIRNYILMRLEPAHQERIYERHWYPMEQLFKTDTQIFDRFMRDYLTMKTRKIARIDTIYKSFKDYCKAQSNLTIDAIIEEIHNFAKLYVAFAFAEVADKDLGRAFGDLKEIDVNVVFPFMLELFDDYSHDLLSKGDFVTIVQYVESYVFRRAICGIPTNSMNKTFATLMEKVTKSQYLQSVDAAFMQLPSYRRFPRDEEFCREFIQKDVYNFQRRRYLLDRLENSGRKEYASLAEYTIEHILPQNPNLLSEWQQDLGPNWKDIQEHYLHTIGNLTLTGYNNVMSDRPFTAKRDIENGFKMSPLQLNAGLGQLDGWNETTIRDRAAKLAERAVKIWPIPKEVPFDAAIIDESFSMPDQEWDDVPEDAAL